MNESAAPTQDPGSARALQCLRSVLTAEEKLEAWAIQRRIFALKQRRLIVGATSGRLVAVSRSLLGGFDLTDIRWQDLTEVHIHVGIFAASLRLSAYASPDLASAGAPLRSVIFEGLRTDQAKELYRICQARDQAWREKRRIRDLEELRARAGGIQLGAAGVTPGAGAAAVGGEDATARLRSAKALLDGGLISDAEYESIKARIISNV